MRDLGKIRRLIAPPFVPEAPVGNVARGEFPLGKASARGPVWGRLIAS
jgi:hypothetical protein